MTNWIFQLNPDRFNIAGSDETDRPRRFNVTRYREPSRRRPLFAELWAEAKPVTVPRNLDDLLKDIDTLVDWQMSESPAAQVERGYR